MKAKYISQLSTLPTRYTSSLSPTQIFSIFCPAIRSPASHCYFSNTTIRFGNWLLPSKHEEKKSRKGRPRVHTGGSSRGTTVVWGDYGLRMCDHHRRIPSSALKIGEDAIKVRLKGMRYRFYKRICANIGVYTKGNEV